MNALALTQSLLQCPSVTPLEGGALDLLHGILHRAGFSCERMIFSDENTPTIDNLYARFGTEEPYLLFAGHTDVVPTGDIKAWTKPPFSGDIHEAHVYGRGAVDMKGAIACFVEAALNHVKTPFKGSIGFLITGDEEGPAINGTVKMLESLAHRGETFTHAIVGEPTNVSQLGDMVKIGRRGSLSAIITLTGAQGHVAYPHLASNPLPISAKLATALAGLKLDDGNVHFDASNLELTSIDTGNMATNVIPASVTIKLNIRYNDEHSLISLQDLIKNTAANFATDKITTDVSFVKGASESFITKPGDFVSLVSQSITKATGLTPKLSTSGGTSDARFIKNYAPVIEFGLVGQTMHKTDERVAVKDLDRLTTIYSEILQSYFM
jgi:succinyl-diaminopimelate desuccinylase